MHLDENREQDFVVVVQLKEDDSAPVKKKSKNLLLKVRLKGKDCEIFAIFRVLLRRKAVCSQTNKHTNTRIAINSRLSNDDDDTKQ